ncbi:uncharacterized protein LOC142466763 isoform X2 [Ascaphus truei]
MPYDDDDDDSYVAPGGEPYPQMNLVCWACREDGHMEDICPKMFKDKQLQKQATPCECKQNVEATSECVPSTTDISGANKAKRKKKKKTVPQVTGEVTETPALSGHASERRRDVLQTGVTGRIVTGTVAEDKEALVSALQAARHDYEVLWQGLVKERECWKKEREANAELQRCILPALQEYEALKKTESLLRSELEEVTTSLEKANTVIATMDEKQIKSDKLIAILKQKYGKALQEVHALCTEVQNSRLEGHGMNAELGMLKQTHEIALCDLETVKQENESLKIKNSDLTDQAEKVKKQLTQEKLEVQEALQNALMHTQSQHQEEMDALRTELRDVCTKQNSLAEELNVLKKEKSVRIIQKHCKALIQGRRERENYRRKRAATIILQAAYRGMKIRQFNRRNKAACVLQSFYRARMVRNRFLIMKGATIKIQSLTRMTQNRIRYQTLINASLVIQRYFRLNKCRPQEREAQDYMPAGCKGKRPQGTAGVGESPI